MKMKTEGAGYSKDRPKLSTQKRTGCWPIRGESVRHVIKENCPRIKTSMSDHVSVCQHLQSDI